MNEYKHKYCFRRYIYNNAFHCYDPIFSDENTVTKLWAHVCEKGYTIIWALCSFVLLLFCSVQTVLNFVLILENIVNKHVFCAHFFIHFFVYMRQRLECNKCLKILNVHWVMRFYCCSQAHRVTLPANTYILWRLIAIQMRLLTELVNFRYEVF